jgi:predicted ester cyclase
MEQITRNKEFLIKYVNALSGVAKPRTLLQQYITDEGLIGHIEFFEAAFPKYELFVDEMTAEGNRVVVKARFKGTHLGAMGNMAPTYRPVELQFAIRYEIENDKIISHWMLADQTSLFEQLGVLPAAEAAH